MILPLSDFIDKHTGQTGWVVGKGRTDFDYSKLAGRDPVFLINDAVLLESYLTKSQRSYMTFLDYSQRMWLDRPLKSIVLCPHEHSVNASKSPSTVVVYQKDPDLTKLQKTPETPLFVDRGTICTMLSFAWLTGVSAINFVGCDGINDSSKRPYDQRIPNLSGGVPAWEYDIIRWCQEELCRKLHLPFQYLGTPVESKTPEV